MLTVEQALDAILTHVRTLPAVPTPLLEARGRVLAADVFADIDNPPFTNSAVDGYAVRAEDTTGASAETPILLQSLGEVSAGGVPTEIVRRGTCLRVMTGAPLPAGADAMVMVEDTAHDGSETNGAYVRILAPSRPGEHVRPAGEDVRKGARVLTAGTRVGSAEIAMLAAMGQVCPTCIRLPRVAVVSTGDELVDVGSTPQAGQIRDSNRLTLAALVGEAEAELHATLHLPDSLETTEAAFRRFAGLEGDAPADVIVTSGGVSVGDRDFVKPALERLGTLDLWRVKMKPGKPLAFGRIGETLFFGLPGNPVSTLVTFELFVRPALWKQAGRSALQRPRLSVTLTDDVPHTPGRREYVRAHVFRRDPLFYADPTGAQGSGILSSLLGANALLIVPEESNGVRAGERLEAILLDCSGLETKT